MTEPAMRITAVLMIIAGVVLALGSYGATARWLPFIAYASGWLLGGTGGLMIGAGAKSSDDED